MRVKRGNPKLISGVLLPPFILNYILIRVKERGLNKKKKKRTEREGESNEKGETKLGEKFACLITNLRWR